MASPWWLPKTPLVEIAPTERVSAAEMDLIFLELDPSPPSSTPASEDPNEPSPEDDSEVDGGLLSFITVPLGDAVSSMADAVSTDTLLLSLDSLDIMSPSHPAGINGLMFGAARAGMLLLITLAALWVMTHETLQSRTSIRELLPRVVIAFVATEMSLKLLKWIVVHVNAITTAILKTGLHGASDQDIGSTIIKSVVAQFAGQPWMTVTLLLGVFVMLTLLLLGMVIQSLLLMLLAITAPVALACHALRITEPIARTWWRVLGGIVASILGQTLVMVLWMNLFFDGQFHGFLAVRSDRIREAANMLLIMALLWLMHKALTVPMKRAWASVGGSPFEPLGRLAKSAVTAHAFGLASLGGAGKLLPRKSTSAPPPKSPAQLAEAARAAKGTTYRSARFHGVGRAVPASSVRTAAVVPPRSRPESMVSVVTDETPVAPSGSAWRGGRTPFLPSVTPPPPRRRRTRRRPELPSLPPVVGTPPRGDVSW